MDYSEWGCVCGSLRQAQHHSIRPNTLLLLQFLAVDVPYHVTQCGNARLFPLDRSELQEFTANSLLFTVPETRFAGFGQNSTILRQVGKIHCFFHCYWRNLEARPVGYTQLWLPPRDSTCDRTSDDRDSAQLLRCRSTSRATPNLWPARG